MSRTISLVIAAVTTACAPRPQRDHHGASEAIVVHNWGRELHEKTGPRR